MGLRHPRLRIKGAHERRVRGGIMTMTVIVDEKRLQPVMQYEAPCCGARFYSTYGDPPRVCPECAGVLTLPTHLEQQRVVEQAPTLLQRVSRYVS